MGIIAERLNNMVIRASSPDNQIEASLEPDGRVDIVFRPGTYRHYRERGLEQQLSRLALRVWTGYQRGNDRAVAEATGGPVSRSTESWDAVRRRFRAEQSETVAEGMSPREFVYIRTTGMLGWDFVIRDGAIRALDEPGFVTEVRGAYRAMTVDYRHKMSDLRARHYGTDLFSTSRLSTEATTSCLNTIMDKCG